MMNTSQQETEPKLDAGGQNHEGHKTTFETISCSQFFYQQSFPHKGELPPALLVPKDIASNGFVQGLLAPVVFGQGLQHLTLNEAVKGFQEAFPSPFAVGLCEFLNHGCFDVV